MDELATVKFDPARLRLARGSRKGVDVARALGISPQRLHAYETGKDNPQPDVLIRLCLFYCLPIQFFSNLENN